MYIYIYIMVQGWGRRIRREGWDEMGKGREREGEGTEKIFFLKLILYVFLIFYIKIINDFYFFNILSNISLFANLNFFIFHLIDSKYCI